MQATSADGIGLAGVTFGGNLPKPGEKALDDTASGFIIHYYKNRSGLTPPEWNG